MSEWAEMFIRGDVTVISLMSLTVWCALAKPETSLIATQLTIAHISQLLLKKK